jgi:DNA-binding winged helix-turn-helix (wHTH) protein
MEYGARWGTRLLALPHGCRITGKHVIHIALSQGLPSVRYWLGNPRQRNVFADGRPVKLGGRALDVLMAQIEAHGAVVSKEALMARVWPGRIIEENSVASQIAALRVAFEAERALIRTVSGRGYQFAGRCCIRPARGRQQRP